MCVYGLGSVVGVATVYGRVVRDRGFRHTATPAPRANQSHVKREAAHFRGKSAREFR